MLFNKTKNKLITDEIIHCSSFISKATGLMFSSKKNLLFEFNSEQKEPLHMFFVFYSINVLFLDKDKNIVEIKKKLSPFTMYFPKAKAKYVIELSKDYLDYYAVGDQLEF